MNDLRKLAEAATPGPWTHGFRDGSGVASEDGGGWITFAETEIVVVRGGRDGYGVPYGVESAKDAAYIAAASPDMILGLLDRIAELEKALRRLLEARHNQVHNGDILDCGPFGADCPLCAPVWDLLENVEAARSSSKVETGVEKS